MTDDVREKILADIDNRIKDCKYRISLHKTDMADYEERIADYERDLNLYRDNVRIAKEDIADYERQIRELEEAKKEL